MKRSLLTIALVISATAAYPSSTLERVKGDMAKAGYSAECIAKLTSKDATKIKMAQQDPEMSSANRDRKVNAMFEKVCGG